MHCRKISFTVIRNFLFMYEILRDTITRNNLRHLATLYDKVDFRFLTMAVEPY